MRWRGGHLGVTLTLAMLAAGCEMLPAEGEGIGGTATLPRLDEIRHARPERNVEARQPALRAQVLRIELPMDASLEAAWEVVDQEAAPAVIAEAWRRNGVRLGVLDVSAVEAFIERLPPATATRNRLVMTDRPDPVAVYRSPELVRPIAVDVAVPPLAPTREVLRQGNAQLLARKITDDETATINTGDGVLVELLLHHHREQVTLHTRLPQEKLLDGRVFHELAAEVLLQPQQRLVVGLHRVIVEPSQDTPHEGEADDASPELAEDERAELSALRQADPPQDGTPEQDAAANPASPTFEPLPAHFGRQLLTGRRLGRNVQVLLVIEFE